MQTSKSLSDWLGYLKADELALLKKIASEELAEPGSIAVNIGAGAGTSGMALAESAPYATRITIDISPGGPLGGLESERNAFEGQLDKLPIQVLGDSYAVGKDWNYGQARLIFIDGDHSEDGIRRDIEAWLPNLTDGGVIFFHDYESEHWGAVVKEVDRVITSDTEHYQVIGRAYSTIAFRKVKNESQDDSAPEGVQVGRKRHKKSR